MTPETIVDTIYKNGGLIRIDGGQLRVSAPKGVVTAEIADCLKSNRDSVFELVAKRDAQVVGENHNSALRKMTLDDFAVAEMVVAIFSAVVGETVYFASDDKELELDALGHYKGKVVYRASELRELVKSTAEYIRTIHEVKKLFGGMVKPDTL
jgi:hypothetical protein